jgi:hypothetical protein
MTKVLAENNQVDQLGCNDRGIELLVKILKQLNRRLSQLPLILI